jgi:peptidoglycan/LPS O-acetylase OafA/YrhL
LDTIQALRGLAALAVMFFHLGGTQVLGGILDRQSLFQYGWMGVDLFFVISGFIMVWVTQNITPGWRTGLRFLAIRVARIYPLWWACSIILALVYFVIHSAPASLHIVAKEHAWSHFVQSFFLVPHKYGPSVIPGWSLIHELYFYLVFAVIILAGLRKRLWVPLLLWTLFTIAGLYFLPADKDPWPDIIINTYTFHFITGCITGLLALKYQRYPFIVMALGILIIAGVIATGSFDPKLRVLQLSIPCGFIVYGMVAAELSERLKSPRVLTWLGDISYSLYITHFLTLLAWSIVKPIYPGGFLYGFVADLPPVLLLFLDTLILVAGCLMVAQIFYSLVEKPALKFFRKRLPSYRH